MEPTEEDNKLLADTAIEMSQGINPSELKNPSEQIKPKKKKGRYCKNPNCGWKIIEYPIWKGQELGEPFAFNKINWYNLLVGDWTKLMLMIAILGATWAYWHDTVALNKIYDEPCSFVMKNYQTCLTANQTGEQYGLMSNGSFYLKNVSLEVYGQSS